MNTIETDERYMREALKEAQRAAEMGEVPIGAVVVCDGGIVARAHNRRECDEDPSAHAEFSAMVAAARALGRWRLSGCTVYVTLEPCLMCAGLMVNARIDRCVFGARDPKGGATGSLYRVQGDRRLNHTFEVTEGVLERECASLLTSFFSSLRGKERVGSECGEPCRCGGAAEDGPHAVPTALLAMGPRADADPMELECIEDGMRCASPEITIAKAPLLDGFPQSVEAARAMPGAMTVQVDVAGLRGGIISVPYSLVHVEVGTYAVIDAARPYRGESPDALYAPSASSWATGELVRDALERGAQTIYLGLGGDAAPCDGGAGFLRALGARFTARDADCPPGLLGLGTLAAIDLGPARDLVGSCRLVALAVDRRMPLVGRRGAVQGSSGHEMLLRACREGGIGQPDALLVGYGRALDEARARLRPEGGDADAAPTRAFRSVLGVPGSGASGGLGAAMLALGARLVTDADEALSIMGCIAQIDAADLVVLVDGGASGESTRSVVKAAIGRASRARIPVVVLSDNPQCASDDGLYDAGAGIVLPLGGSDGELRRAGRAACRAWQLAGC